MTEPRFGESFEILPASNGGNGVPRSAWFRNRRISTWHRPYAASLLVLDYVAVVLANFTTIVFLEKARSGFQDDPTLFNLIAYLFLPVAWLIVLWGQGAYDRRYLGVGTDEFKRVVRAGWTIAAIVAFLAFGTKTALSRLTVGVALVASLAFILLLRYAVRRALHLLRERGRATHRLLLVGTLPEALEVHTAISRAPGAGL